MIEVLDRPKSVITPDYPYPVVIQGGMGAGVSLDALPRSIAIASARLEKAGESLQKKTLGVVSLTGLPSIFVYKLQKGDLDFIDALDHFPDPEVRDRIKEKYVGTVDPANEAHFKLAPKPENLIGADPAKRREAAELTIVASYCAVWLAKQGHDGPIGVNVLEKIQTPHLYELLGAMMAGVDYVLMGAGIPKQIPAVLENFSRGQAATYDLDVQGIVAGSREKYEMHLDPREYIQERYLGTLTRPRFLAIISSDTLAHYLVANSLFVDGFIVEDKSAGGHNAPPRGKYKVNSFGEPVYRKKDAITLEVIKNILQLERPTWLAGGRSGPEQLLGTQALGVTGVQIGTIGAYSKESGFLTEIKTELIRKKFLGESRVLTSAICSPSGFPFQVEQDLGLARPEVYSARKRQCLYGYLAQAFRTQDGTIDFRCPAEPELAYVGKGGKIEDTAGKACLCSALLSAVGCGRSLEPYIITAGKNYDFMQMMVMDENGTYTAEDVIRYEFGLN